MQFGSQDKRGTCLFGHDLPLEKIITTTIISPRNIRHKNSIIAALISDSFWPLTRRRDTLSPRHNIVEWYHAGSELLSLRAGVHFNPPCGQTLKWRLDQNIQGKRPRRN